MSQSPCGVSHHHHPHLDLASCRTCGIREDQLRGRARAGGWVLGSVMPCHSTRFSPIVAFAAARTLPNRTNLIHNVALFCFCRIGKPLGSGFFFCAPAKRSSTCMIRYRTVLECRERNEMGWAVKNCLYIYNSYYFFFPIWYRGCSFP